MKRSPMPPRRTPLPKVRARLPRESAKRKSQRPSRRAVVDAVFLRDRYTCQFWSYVSHNVARTAPGSTYPGSCGGPLDPHEVIPRSAWADGALDPSNVVSLCRLHHDWVGDNPDDAHAIGLHGYSWERPDQKGTHP